MKIKKILAGAAASTIMTVAMAFSAVAASTLVYDNIPSSIPGNVPSVGFQATQTAEFGSQVGLASTERTDPTVTVLMSSWGCEAGSWYNHDCTTTPGATFDHPITLNVYSVGVGDAVGSLITTKTQTFTMPYRPSSDPACTGADAGKWSDGSQCYNGKSFPIVFDLTGTTLPDKVIIGVAYNTTTWGSSPIGTQACDSTPQGCPYDSLNVGTNGSPSIGLSLPSNDQVYWNTSIAGNYADGGAGGVGTFRLDSNWSGYLPAIRVEANPALVGPPADMNQCKKDGWKTFNNPTFKNQGDCVSYVQSSPKAVGNKAK